MAIKERDIKKATKAVGTSYEVKQAPKKNRGASRTGAFQGAVDDISVKTPSSWKAVVDGAIHG